MSNFNDKINMEMIKVISDAVKLVAEIEKMAGIYGLNWDSGRKVKRQFKLTGFLNNYDAITVNGLSMDEAISLLNSEGIEAKPFQDDKGYYILTINKIDYKKLSRLEKKIESSELDLDDFFNKYHQQKDAEKGTETNIIENEPEIILDSEEITEEEFNNTDLFETDANLELVAQNLISEKKSMKTK